ncbi:Activating molecule in BECN1-regulated autophagy protein 1 [Fasciola hepatica]|uniref:Activating molecule in BECN1-regulated autophagy protein 1 n=1 Tax=Fasciola hepatica TaxID=6192 RepID=A0A4E0R8K5_FASHE|nr:Activating molecule in BECN1-regulated autophagy protein 1 [Fasciola hepatica]
MSEIHHSDRKSMIQYVSSRERGAYSSGCRQTIPEVLTCVRRMKPVIAATPSDCRSTYLLRLNLDNKLLAAAHGDRSVAVYCASTGALLAKCVGHERSPWTLAFHPCQPHLLASGCLGGNIRLWNLECLANVDSAAQTETQQILSTSVWKHSGAIASLAFHPTHPILVAAWSQEVVFYDWVSGRKLSVWRFVSNHSRVRWVRFSPDGSLLYTATANPSAVHHQLTDNQEIRSQGPSSGSCSHNTKSDRSTKEHNAAAVQTAEIPRDALLRFLVSRPDSWFQQLGICSVCSVRLCRWAGTLGPEFPSPNVDLYRGLAAVTRTAQSLASSMRLSGLPLSHVVQELLPTDSPEILSETTHYLLGDANPAAVAIIEDMPVREFLLSRGNYCPNPSTVIGEAGVCCGGHACDLVLAHRDLMRYSICRSCLAVFWRWASQHVAWWRWYNNTAEAHPLRRAKSSAYAPTTLQADSLKSTESSQIARNPSNQKHVGPVDLSESQPAVGICIRCRAKTNAANRDAQSDFLPLKLKESPLDTSSSEINPRCIPVAALELLQSRLGNANDVTQVTYMASELVSEGAVSKRIDDLLRTQPLLKTVVKPLPDMFLYLLQRATLANSFTSMGSPLSKRRRMNVLDGVESEFTEHITSDSLCHGNVTTTWKSPVHINSGLSEQAALFGHLMVNVSDQPWNKPCCVEIRSPPSRGEEKPPACLELFPYVPTGSRLLRPTVPTKAHCTTPESKRMGIRSISSNFVRLAHNGSEDNLRNIEQSADVDGVNSRFMTACCRCGHIVPQTFPIDPQSSLSAVVCEKLVLSEDQYHSTSALSARQQTIPRRQPVSPHGSSSNVIPNNTSCLTVQPRTVDGIVNRDILSTTNSSVIRTSFLSSTVEEPMASTQPPTSHGLSSSSMFHLINHTNSDSMMHAVNRSITEVIAGLFVNMGEHGSATSLQESTYRVCRWELNLCGPIQTDCAHCSPRKSGHTTDELSLPRLFLPMPANVAVSYNTNSLVIPHARLFNDSSICLSPDGQMLAAFVAPRSDSSRVSELHQPTSEVDNSETSLDTVLAVYRLQPRSQRGQCLFARRFSTCTPVCLDFSPQSEYLAVGMATSRLPSASLPISSLHRLTGSGLIVDSVNSRNDFIGLHGPHVAGVIETPQSVTPSETTLVPVRHAFVARIFRLERAVKSCFPGRNANPVVRQLKETVRVQHPGMSESVPAFSVRSPSQSSLDDVHSRWHRLLLSSPTGISLNTIVWNPHGGLFYGTTKGLVILMQSEPDTCQSNVDLILGIPSMLSTKDVEFEEDNLCTNSQTKRKYFVHRPTPTARRFVRLAQHSSLSP